MRKTAIKVLDFWYRIIDYIMELVFLPIKIKQGRVVCINFNGKGYGCNPKYIVNELVKYECELEIIWLISNVQEKMPEQIKKVHYRSIQALFYLATANVIISNTKNTLRIRKKQNQYVIQTWHASYSPKLLEKALKGNGKYVKESKKNSEQTDLFLSNSRIQTEEYRKNFWCKCEIMECGYPRNDILFSNNEILKKKVLSNLNIESETKLLLYAPTFRDDYSTNAYLHNIEELIEKLNCVKENWKILIRLHPNVSENIELYQYNEQIINVSSYPDIQELLIISDILVTDYSSTMFDFSIMKKPVIIYAPDVDSYKEIRGLKPLFYDLPFPAFFSEKQFRENICTCIQNYNYETVEKFMNIYGNFDEGNASYKVAKKIITIIYGKNETKV